MPENRQDLKERKNINMLVWFIVAFALAVIVPEIICDVMKKVQPEIKVRKRMSEDEKRKAENIERVTKILQEEGVAGYRKVQRAANGLPDWLGDEEFGEELYKMRCELPEIYQKFPEIWKAYKDSQRMLSEMKSQGMIKNRWSRDQQNSSQKIVKRTSGNNAAVDFEAYDEKKRQKQKEEEKKKEQEKEELNRRFDEEEEQRRQQEDDRETFFLLNADPFEYGWDDFD